MRVHDDSEEQEDMKKFNKYKLIKLNYTSERTHSQASRDFAVRLKYRLSLIAIHHAEGNSVRLEN